MTDYEALREYVVAEVTRGTVTVTAVNNNASRLLRWLAAAHEWNALRAYLLSFSGEEDDE